MNEEALLKMGLGEPVLLQMIANTGPVYHGRMETWITTMDLAEKGKKT